MAYKFSSLSISGLYSCSYSLRFLKPTKDISSYLLGINSAGSIGISTISDTSKSKPLREDWIGSFTDSKRISWTGDYFSSELTNDCFFVLSLLITKFYSIFTAGAYSFGIVIWSKKSRGFADSSAKGFGMVFGFYVY